jgi:hypothetical protein
MKNVCLVVFVGLALCACDGGEEEIDAGMTDAGNPGTDAGRFDAGGDEDAGPQVDAGPRVDAGPITCTEPSLDPVADATGTPDLIISEIDPGSFIEVFNTTSAPIALGAPSTFQFCSPFTYQPLATLAPGVVVAPGGYAQLPWPSAFDDTDAGGEIILFASSDFGTNENIMDFVCWGTNPHSSRMGQATAISKWSNACLGAITAGRSLQRVAATDGASAASYVTDATPTPETCTP